MQNDGSEVSFNGDDEVMESDGEKFSDGDIYSDGEIFSDAETIIVNDEYREECKKKREAEERGEIPVKKIRKYSSSDDEEEGSGIIEFKRIKRWHVQEESDFDQDLSPKQSPEDAESSDESYVLSQYGKYLLPVVNADDVHENFNLMHLPLYICIGKKPTNGEYRESLFQKYNVLCFTSQFGIFKLKKDFMPEA